MPPHLFGCGPAALRFAFSVSSPPTALLATEPCRVYGPAFPFPLFPPPCPAWFVFLRVLRVLCGLLFCVSSVFSVVCFSPCSLCPLWFAFLRVLRGLFFSVSSVFSVLLARGFFSAREDFLCRNRSELPARPQPPRLFGCGYAALWFAFSVPSASVPSPPPVTTFPKSFFLSFSTTSQLPLSSPLAPLLYVESERCG